MTITFRDAHEACRLRGRAARPALSTSAHYLLPLLLFCCSVQVAQTAEPPLQITTTVLPAAGISNPYGAPIAVSGGIAPYTWHRTGGALPLGLSLDSSTGLVSGTPAAVGVFSFTLVVSDSASTPALATRNFTIPVGVGAPDAGLAISTTSVPSAVVGTAYSATVAASGGVPPLSWAVASGTLPPGLSVGLYSGEVSGTPTASGSYTFDLAVRDSAAQPVTVTRRFTIAVSGTSALTISTSRLSDGRVGYALSRSLAATGGKSPYSWSVSEGTLPPGVTLNAATGLLSGTPTTPGSFPLVFRVTDSSTQAKAATKSLPLTIRPATLTISTSSLPSGNVAKAYSHAVAAAGGVGPYAWAISAGALPAGLSLNSSTGVISGTPTTVSTATVTLRVTDSASPAVSASRALTLAILPSPLTILTQSLPAGSTGTAYSRTLGASGGISPYKWSVAGGTLPAGIGLATGTGVLSGTPTAAGTYSFTVQVTDNAGTPVSVTRALSLVISGAAPLTISTTSLPGATSGAPYSGNLAASGGVSPYSWRVAAGSLPTGLTLNAATGAISGQTSTAGTFNLTFEVTDTAGAKSTRALSLTVGSNSTTISVVSPAPNARVQGQITLSVNLQNAAAVASVEYLLNGRSISGLLTQSPYSLPWRTGSVYDSRSTLKAVARNAAGAIIATSAEVPFTIANGTVELTHVSPDPSVTASGVVTWTVTTNLPSTVGKPIFFCFLDGRMARQHFTNDRFSTISVDTTQLGNGPHEFYCTLDAEASVFRYGLAMTQVVVNVNNGRAPRELRSRWREVLLLPGETVSLSPKLVYTNGEEEATTASFSSANSAIASVDSTGVVRGNSVGTTTVTLNSQGRTDTVTVIVRSAAILPHFSKSGGFLNAYDPAKSTFVRGLISMGYSEVEQPGMSDRIKEASINTLNVGFYYNPYYERSTSFSQWRVGMDNMLNRVTEVARANDLSLYLIGDDIARQPEYLHNTLYNSWSPQALQHVLGWARDSGRVIGIDMVDEIDFMWGDTPTPTDGRWSSKTPPLGNDAFIRLMSIMNAVPGRPKLTFPASGAANNQTVRNWMANPAFSDFSSIYWHFRDWRRAYPLSGTNHQIISNVDRTVSERQPVLFQNRPTMLLTSIMGPEYVKLGPGSEFVPGQDKMLTQGTTPEQVALTALYAAATGMAGVRTYSYDQDYQNEIRKNTPPGVGQHQTGSDPNRTGTDRWQAMASAFGVIRQIEPYLLQPKMHAIDLGAQFTTGARQGPASRLLIAIHAGDAPATTWVDLSPYQYAGAQGVTCYRLLGAKLSTEVHATVPSGLTTFAPGEVIVWLFEPSTVVPAPAVRITSPLQDMIVSGTAQIHATVSSPQLSRVEFYVDGKLVSTQTGAPFRTSIDAATLSSGVWHGVTVRAWDQRGRSNDARVSFRTVQ